MRLRASYGTLGFLKGKIVRGQRTAYFMLDGKCVFDCTFCSHARSATSDQHLLSRILWKDVEVEEALEIARHPEVRRICFQVVSYPGYRNDLLKLLNILRGKPISASVRAASMEEIREYFKAGLDRLGLAIDAVTEELYRKHRGGSLGSHLKLLESASWEFPGRITTHIIVGLGESERDLVEMMSWMRNRGIEVALFAFTPIKGTALENHPRPPLDVYRRVQIARYLIFEKNADVDDVIFDEEGRISGFRIELGPDFKKAFLTSGCPDCTRPFYNEKPSEEPYNVHDERLLDEINYPILFHRKP